MSLPYPDFLSPCVPTRRASIHAQAPLPEDCWLVALGLVWGDGFSVLLVLPVLGRVFYVALLFLVMPGRVQGKSSLVSTDLCPLCLGLLVTLNCRI